MLSAETRDILALCVLAAIGSSLAGWVVLKMRRSPYSPAQSALCAVNYLLTRFSGGRRFAAASPSGPIKAP